MLANRTHAAHDLRKPNLRRAPTIGDRQKPVRATGQLGPSQAAASPYRPPPRFPRPAGEPVPPAVLLPRRADHREHAHRNTKASPWSSSGHTPSSSPKAGATRRAFGRRSTSVVSPDQTAKAVAAAPVGLRPTGTPLSSGLSGRPLCSLGLNGSTPGNNLLQRFGWGAWHIPRRTECSSKWRFVSAHADGSP